MTQEVLMQRCVDGELSNEQRHQLLEQLEQQPLLWKDLACLYMEDQLLAQAVSEDAVRARLVSKADFQARTSLLADTTAQHIRWKHWFAHPVTSVVLCLCVAFLSGMLLRDNNGPALTTNQASSSTSAESIPYQFTSVESDEFPRAMKNALSELGYNQTEPSKQPSTMTSMFEDHNGRRYLRLIPRNGTGIMIPIDSIQVVYP